MDEGHVQLPERFTPPSVAFELTQHLERDPGNRRPDTSRTADLSQHSVDAARPGTHSLADQVGQLRIARSRIDDAACTELGEQFQAINLTDSGPPRLARE